MKNRNITSFEPDQDVHEMLIEFSQRGITIKELANRALRKYGERTAKEIAAEKRRRLSFEPPDAAPFGFDLIAA